MSVKVVKKINLILLVVACIAFFAGIPLSRKAAKEAATDVSKIDVQITAKECRFNQYDGSYGRYYIDLTYEITNKTKVDWAYLKVATYVYDKNGKSLGRINSEFGSSFGSSDFKLKSKETVIKDSTIDKGANNPGEFFMAMYESDFSDLIFESEVTYGSYYD